MHIDTHYKIPEMIAFRDQIAKDWKLNMVYGENREALEQKQTYPDGAISRVACCGKLKTEALKKTLSAEWPRYVINHRTGKYEREERAEPYTGVIVGAPFLMKKAVDQKNDISLHVIN